VAKTVRNVGVATNGKQRLAFRNSECLSILKLNVTDSDITALWDKAENRQIVLASVPVEEIFAVT
jgi:hypothetical protein